MKCVCPDVEPDEADVKFMLAEVDMDGNEQIDRNELLPLLAVPACGRRRPTPSRR